MGACLTWGGCTEVIFSKVPKNCSFNCVGVGWSASCLTTIWNPTWWKKGQGSRKVNNDNSNNSRVHLSFSEGAIGVLNHQNINNFYHLVTKGGTFMMVWLPPTGKHGLLWKLNKLFCSSNGSPNTLTPMMGNYQQTGSRSSPLSTLMILQQSKQQLKRWTIICTASLGPLTFRTITTRTPQHHFRSIGTCGK